MREKNNGIPHFLNKHVIAGKLELFRQADRLRFCRL